MDDTQAYIRMDCTEGNPVSALGVDGNLQRPLITKIVAYNIHLELAFRPCVSGDLNKKKLKKLTFCVSPLDALDCNFKA